jgi:hypothetical protein
MVAEMDEKAWLEGKMSDADYQESQRIKLRNDQIEGNVALVVLTLGDGVALIQGVRALSAGSGAGRVFWSGGDLAKDSAMEFAKLNGMKTLEMTTTGRVMNTITPYVASKISTPVWNSLSKNFASGTAGEANFFTINAGPRATSIWSAIEKPILERNGINIITHIK